MVGKQQVAILAKFPAQAAWAEHWKSAEGIDPPRGFAFAWFKIAGADVGIYSVHLKSNLIRRGDKAKETTKNIRKREIATAQLLDHARNTIATAMPMVKCIIIGGDFNTSLDQAEFARERTLGDLTGAGFVKVMSHLSPADRVTHPGNGRYPDATFDYLFAFGAAPARPQIVRSAVSDHFPVTCSFSVLNGFRWKPE
jgi:endonuclease/exonuclease/phosphatase family metal-dependent hydrolase